MPLFTEVPTGTLLLVDIEVEPPARKHPLKQRFWLWWWGHPGECPPVSPQHDPRLQPPPLPPSRSLARIPWTSFPPLPAASAPGGVSSVSEVASSVGKSAHTPTNKTRTHSTPAASVFLWLCHS